jgi:hypothetical protein
MSYDVTDAELFEALQAETQVVGRYEKALREIRDLALWGSDPNLARVWEIAVSQVGEGN